MKKEIRVRQISAAELKSWIIHDDAEVVVMDKPGGEVAARTAVTPDGKQALHCSSIDLRQAGLDRVFTAPMPQDMRAFCAARGIVVPAGL